MSNVCAALVQKRRAGSATKKAVLMYLADRASDDGSGIWTSKSHIAADTELSKRSVQNAMTEFENDGVLVKVGKKTCKSGYTYEYKLVLDAILSLPGTREDRGAGDSPHGVQEIHPCTTFTPRGAGDSPQGVQEIHPNHPRTILEPSNARECADDLFSEISQPPENGDGQNPKKPSREREVFDRFWSEYPRKAEPDAAFKNFKKALKETTPDELISAAANYASQVKIENTETRYIKLAKNWLSSGAWREMACGDQFNEDALSPPRRSMLQDGICPPSMKGEDGTPNSEAAYWLKQYGHGPVRRAESHHKQQERVNA